MNASSAFTSITYSVWDGDWAFLEEYDKSGNLIEKYLQGYHGLVKTFQTVAYYYQDELGSTSHIASSSGALLEYYKYDLYGKPTYFSSTSQPLNSSTFGVRDLFTGQRWVSEIGLYDDRNRFMSTELGRFLQPDPIGFSGDASNLYRYCGNDWANRTDLIGLQESSIGEQDPEEGVYGVDSNGTVVDNGDHTSDAPGCNIAIGAPSGESSSSGNAAPNSSGQNNGSPSGNTPNSGGANAGSNAQPSGAGNGNTPSTARSVGSSASQGGDGISRVQARMANYHMEIDPAAMRRFGFNKQQAEAARFFSNVTVYGIAYPAAAAVALPVLPVYLEAGAGIGRGAMTAFRAAPTAWRAGLANAKYATAVTYAGVVIPTATLGVSNPEVHQVLVEVIEETEIVLRP